MKKQIIILLSIGLIFPILVAADTGARNNNYIHPSFKSLLQQYPRKSKIVNPMVPRISGKIVYQLFASKKAMIFAVSSDNLRKGLIAGAISVPRKLEMHPLFLKKVKAIKNKYIVLYCS